MLIKLVKFSEQNLRTETEIVLYGNLTGNAFVHMNDVDCNNLTLYLPQTLFDGKHFYIAKDRTSVFR
jgi:hypothetical protein